MLFRVTVQAHFCEIDSRAQGRMRFGVLVQEAKPTRSPKSVSLFLGVGEVSDS